ncbi:MAG TPA: hypothetical protein VG710_10240 [Opitutus sp.]|nr:hypothetical protein [Opitutus sp.]
MRAPKGVSEDELVKTAVEPKRRRFPLKIVILAAAGVILLTGGFIGYRILTAPLPAPPPLPPHRPVVPAKKPQPTASAPAAATAKPAAEAAPASATAPAATAKVQAAPPPPAVVATAQLAPGVTASIADGDVSGAASSEFRTWVSNARVNGVLGTPPRALINGRTVRAGDTVDEPLGITFAGVDVSKHSLVFRDRSGAIVRRRY